MLGRLRTEQGERPTLDAVSQCSRCGYCEQACPTYVASGREPYNPRGRNQLVRLLLEDKLADRASAMDALSTCLLCGACSTACYAHIPTPDIVLEGRRLLRERPPLLLRALRRLIEDRRGLFDILLKAAHALKRAGFARLVSRSRVLGLLGLGGIELAERHIEEAPLAFLAQRLRTALPPRPEARWSYFVACGTNYLFPRVGLASVRVLERSRGPGRFLDNPCCGLLFYNYGDLEAARRLARRNIERAEGGEPIVLDCSSCAAHLKSYPQLFLEEPEWKGRAEAFSARVKDIIEMLPNSAPQASLGRVITYHDSCRARHGQGLEEEPRRWMRARFPGYVELQEAGFCCGGAGAFAFAQPELSDEVLRRKVSRIAQAQARFVATSSTSCLLQLAHGLKKYYPECEAVHVVELAAEES